MFIYTYYKYIRINRRAHLILRFQLILGPNFFLGLNLIFGPYPIPGSCWTQISAPSRLNPNSFNEKRHHFEKSYQFNKN